MTRATLRSPEEKSACSCAIRADITRTSTFGMRARFFESHFKRLFNSFSSQIGSHWNGVFGLGDEPVRAGKNFAWRLNFLTGLNIWSLMWADQLNNASKAFFRPVV